MTWKFQQTPIQVYNTLRTWYQKKTLNGHISKTSTNLESKNTIYESSFNFLQNSVTHDKFKTIRLKIGETRRLSNTKISNAVEIGTQKLTKSHTWAKSYQETFTQTQSSSLKSLIRSWRWSLPYRNQSINLFWDLYDSELRHERVNRKKFIYLNEFPFNFSTPGFMQDSYCINHYNKTFTWGRPLITLLSERWKS